MSSEVIYTLIRSGEPAAHDVSKMGEAQFRFTFHFGDLLNNLSAQPPLGLEHIVFGHVKPRSISLLFRNVCLSMFFILERLTTFSSKRVPWRSQMTVLPQGGEGSPHLAWQSRWRGQWWARFSLKKHSRVAWLSKRKNMSTHENTFHFILYSSRKPLVPVHPD